MIMADIETLIKAFMAGCYSRNEEYQTESEEKSFNDWFNTKGRELCTDKWISVKDRLPEEERYVLIAHRKATSKDEWQITVGWREYSESKIKWFHENATPVESDIDIYFVYFWQPLHEPPKE